MKILTLLYLISCIALSIAHSFLLRNRSIYNKHLLNFYMYKKIVFNEAFDRFLNIYCNN